MEDYELVTPSAASEWKAYHDIRREVNATTALLRRVAVRSFVAPDAVEFYRACGFGVEQEGTAGRSANEPVFMTKPCL